MLNGKEIQTRISDTLNQTTPVNIINYLQLLAADIWVLLARYLDYRIVKDGVLPLFAIVLDLIQNSDLQIKLSSIRLLDMCIATFNCIPIITTFFDEKQEAYRNIDPDSIIMLRGILDTEIRVDVNISAFALAAKMNYLNFFKALNVLYNRHINKMLTLLQQPNPFGVTTTEFTRSRTNHFLIYRFRYNEFFEHYFASIPLKMDPVAVNFKLIIWCVRFSPEYMLTGFIQLICKNTTMTIQNNCQLLIDHFVEATAISELPLPTFENIGEMPMDLEDNDLSNALLLSADERMKNTRKCHISAEVQLGRLRATIIGTMFHASISLHTIDTFLSLDYKGVYPQVERINDLLMFIKTHEYVKHDNHFILVGNLLARCKSFAGLSSIIEVMRLGELSSIFHLLLRYTGKIEKSHENTIFNVLDLIVLHLETPNENRLLIINNIFIGIVSELLGCKLSSVLVNVVLKSSQLWHIFEQWSEQLPNNEEYLHYFFYICCLCSYAHGVAGIIEVADNRKIDLDRTVLLYLLSQTLQNKYSEVARLLIVRPEIGSDDLVEKLLANREFLSNEIMDFVFSQITFNHDEVENIFEKISSTISDLRPLRSTAHTNNTLSSTTESDAVLLSQFSIINSGKNSRDDNVRIEKEHEDREDNVAINSTTALNITKRYESQHEIKIDMSQIQKEDETEIEDDTSTAGSPHSSNHIVEGLLRELRMV